MLKRRGIKRVLITGATGFVGSHLIEYLLKYEDLSIYATQRHRSKLDNVEHLLDNPRVKWLLMQDITDSHSVLEAVKQARPHWCFHLCGQSFVPASWNAPQETVSANMIGTINVLEAIRQVSPSCRIQIAGSSEEYGMVKISDIPIKETAVLRPLSPYAISKVGEDLLGYQYFMSYGMEIIRTRAFNHSGPRRGEMFVCSNFAMQIAKIEKGLQRPVITVGNLSARRDFTDVRDVVRAYYLALKRCKAGEVYNICSQKSYSVREILEILLKLTDLRPRLKVEPEKLRPSDVPHLVGDSRKFRKATGWKPEIPIEKTLKDLLDYWRHKLEA